jgi:hypothetical protein
MPNVGTLSPISPSERIKTGISRAVPTASASLNRCLCLNQSKGGRKSRSTRASSSRRGRRMSEVGTRERSFWSNQATGFAYVKGGFLSWPQKLASRGSPKLFFLSVSGLFGHQFLHASSSRRHRCNSAVRPFSSPDRRPNSAVKQRREISGQSKIESIIC